MAAACRESRPDSHRLRALTVLLAAVAVLVAEFQTYILHATERRSSSANAITFMQCRCRQAPEPEPEQVQRQEQHRQAPAVKRHDEGSISTFASGSIVRLNG